MHRALVLLLVASCETSPAIPPAVERAPERVRPQPVERPDPVDTATPSDEVQSVDLPPQTPEDPPARSVSDPRLAHYLEPGPSSIVALQPWRSESSAGEIAVINLNDGIDLSWVVSKPGADTLHVESGEAHEIRASPSGIEIDGVPCDPWTQRDPGRPWDAICDGSLYVRSTLKGRRSLLEQTTDALRDNVPWGEQITVFVRDNILADRYLVPADVQTLEEQTDRPTRAPPDADAIELGLARTDLGIPVAGIGPLQAGHWVAVTDQADVYLSAFAPRALTPERIAANEGVLEPPDATEDQAMIYLVAFDLQAFELDYMLGTDHPRLDWSDRALTEVVDGMDGPDGYAPPVPLQRPGQVPPWAQADLAAAFTGGFKRSHGAFKWGPLAKMNRGSHYGFVERGVVWSRPQPGLATLVVGTNGEIELLTWTDPDPMALEDVLHLRQNGMPLVERGEDGTGAAGATVDQWAEGNWSGSAEGTLRAMRSGVCLIETDDSRYLVYGYFTGATPSAMALTFLAYGCDYAFLLDMNALEHTYMAVYEHDGNAVIPHHLDTGMAVLDDQPRQGIQARFVAVPDNRDFFYITRRSR